MGTGQHEGMALLIFGVSTLAQSISSSSISPSPLTKKIRSCIRSDTSLFIGGPTFPFLHLPVSFNKSISWQHGSVAVRSEVLHGIKVALQRIKSKKRKAKESGGK